MTKLILSNEVETQISEILAPLKNPEKWMSLGLSFAPSPYAVVRLEGLPGTGKTALANYIARKLRSAPLHIDFSSVASSTYGETEEKIVSTFKHAKETETNTIIMEECDALLWSRDKVTDETMYVLGIVNTLLIQLDKFCARQIPSLVILTSNYPQLLDAALTRRITDVIKLEAPKGKHSIQMWREKLPKCFFPGMYIEQLEALAYLGATPDQMEKAILKICRKAMLENREPTFADFQLT